MNPATRWLVCSDLDGTLLERETYGFEAARPALQALRERRIPVIPVTSKTRAEIDVISEHLDLHGPAVIENGAAVLIPDSLPALAGSGAQRQGHWLAHSFGAPREQILDTLHGLRRDPECRFAGFADWDDAEVARHTGLTHAAAARARQRQASEPLLWLGSERALERFRDALAEAGLRLVQGGRFWHVLGRVDKADALLWLRQRYSQLWRRPVATVALGDSHNDLGMLEAADIAVVIQSPHAGALSPSGPRRVLRSTLPGPAGWAQAMLTLLREELPDAAYNNENQ